MTDTTAFEFFANHAALDFVNTVQHRYSNVPELDLVATVDDLLAWLTAAGLLDADRVEDFREGDSRAALREARRLREALWDVFSTAIQGAMPPIAAIADLNSVLDFGARKKRVWVAGERTVVGEEAVSVGTLMEPVASLAELAAELLGSERRLGRVRMCARPDCAGLFYDTSKSGKRRWCDMKGCGNRAKAARHYDRHKSGRYPQDLERAQT